MGKKADSKKSKARDKKSNGAGEAATESFELPVATASMAAFEAAFPAAKALSKSEIKPFRTSIDLVNHNAGIALDALSSYFARVPAELPKIDLAAAKSLPSIVSAIAYVISLDVAPASNVKALVKEAARLRRVLLPIARSAAESGQVPVKDVEKIEVGSGNRDVAQDCLDLASLFVRYQGKLRKGQVDPADVKKAEAAGQALQDALNPSGAKKAKKRAKVEGMFVDEARDRLWTFFLEEFEILWRLGAYFLGRAVNDLVPLPTSTTHVGKKKKKPVAPGANAAPPPPT